MNPVKIAADFSLQSSPAGETPDTGYRDPVMEKQMADAGVMNIIAEDTNLATAQPMNYAMDQQMSDMLRKDIPEKQGIM